MMMSTRQTLTQAIEQANTLGFPYAVQEWKDANGGQSDFVVAHGAGDGIGRTVYATIPRRRRLCSGCGALKPIGQSCICFDNDCQ